MSSNSSTSSSPAPGGSGGDHFGQHHQPQQQHSQTRQYARAHPPFRPPNRSRRQNVDYGMRNSLAQLGTRELHGLDVYRWEDDDLSLRSGAAQARLPYDRMTKAELELFPEMAKASASTALFLYIRNRTLVLWQLDPLVELTVVAILRELPEPFNSDTELVTAIHAYLQRNGFINFGVFTSLTKRCLDVKKTIIVVGAGASGLAAARQLQFFGFRVIVLEGRSRCGGRVHVSKRPNLPSADLGAMIITGIVGNPLTTLIQQLPVTVFKVNNRCPIYDHQGKLVNSRKDDMIERSFNRILGTLSHLAHGVGITEVEGEGGEPNGKISLGKAFELILNQQELRVHMKRLNYWKKYKELVRRLETATNQIANYRSTIEECLAKLRANGVTNPAEATPEAVSIDFDEQRVSEEEFQRQFRVRCVRKCLELTMAKHDDLERERTNIEHVLMDYKNMEPSFVYMNVVDRRILDFHLANLEYAIGAPLDSVSVKDWDQDDPFGFAGSHMTVKEGLGYMIGRLTAELDVRNSHVVDLIEYDEKGVAVECWVPKPAGEPNGGGGGGKGAAAGPSTSRKQPPAPVKIGIKADAVLCTVPLGVLKRSLFTTAEARDEGGRGSGAIRFQPPLPKWKRDAISSLGFGSLNKIVLFFEKPFWDTKRSSFGRLNETPGSRGELFLFYSNGDLPFLIGLFAGASASTTTQIDDKIVVQKAMAVLHSIFASACPTEPLSFILTRWHQDKFALGCYSYMSLNSSPDDYDALARPLRPGADANEAEKEDAVTTSKTTLPRVFFAGEHTNRHYPSSVHGAFLSGLREAAKIADAFIGPLTASGEVITRASPSAANAMEEDASKPSTSQQGKMGAMEVAGEDDDDLQIID